MSDHLQFLKCFLFHSTQNIAMWLVAIYTIDRNCNCLYCGLNHYLWNILCEGLKGVPPQTFCTMLSNLSRTNVHNTGTPMWLSVEFNNRCYRCTFFTASVHTEPLTVMFNSDLSHHWALKRYV